MTLSTAIFSVWVSFFSIYTEIVTVTETFASIMKKFIPIYLLRYIIRKVQDSTILALLNPRLLSDTLVSYQQVNIQDRQNVSVRMVNDL